MNANRIPSLALLFSVVLLPNPLRAQPADPGAQTLEPVQTEGQRTPLDSRRPEYERMLPCIGCDGASAPPDNFVSRILAYALLPSVPPDLREFTPISLQQPRNPRADKQP